MLDTSLQLRLRDPGYFALHLQAAAAIREVGQLEWYDSHLLRRVEVAMRYLARVRPDRLDDFRDGLALLTPARDFREIIVDDIFDAVTREEIIAVARSAQPVPGERQARENAEFGREVVWRLERFRELQDAVRLRVAQLVGRPLVSSYNFLSRYGPAGRCDVHMDNPEAMFTFDYCIEQDAVWPIYVSRVIDWLGGEMRADFDPAAIITDPGLDFREHRLEPGQALLFNGTSQWHHRRPRAQGALCNMLFFHCYPEGCDDLVMPHRWLAHFGIPELEPLCDLFTHPGHDGLA